MDITHDNVCSSMLSCFYSHLVSTGRPILVFIVVTKYGTNNCGKIMSVSDINNNNNKCFSIAQNLLTVINAL